MRRVVTDRRSAIGLQITRYNPVRAIECGNKVGEKLQWRNQLQIVNRVCACVSRHLRLRYVNEILPWSQDSDVRQVSSWYVRVVAKANYNGRYAQNSLAPVPSRLQV